MSHPYPTYQDEQKAMFREEDHDGSYKVCPTCKEYITEDNYGGEFAEGECDECFCQRNEVEALEAEVGRIAADLSEALRDYRRSRIERRESLRQRITVETLSEALTMIRGALD